MNEIDVFVMVDRALGAVVQQIREDQWSMTMPAGFITSADQSAPTLREIVNYHAYDEAWLPLTLSGAGPDAEGAPRRTDDHLGADPLARFAQLTDAGVAAVEAITDLDRPVHLTYGDWATRDYLLHVTSFRGFRAHDLAQVIGVDATLSDELVQGMWDELSPHFDEYRQWGVYPPAVPVADDAPLLDRLLAGSGRDPADH